MQLTLTVISYFLSVILVQECNELHPLIMSSFSPHQFLIFCFQGPEGEAGPVGATGRPGADVSTFSLVILPLL